MLAGFWEKSAVPPGYRFSVVTALPPGGSAAFGVSAFDFSTKSPAVYTALEAIASANASSSRVATDISKIEAGLTGALTKEQSDAGKLFGADIPALPG